MLTKSPLGPPEAVKTFKSPYYPPFSKGDNPERKVEFCSVSIWESLSFDYEFPSLKKHALSVVEGRGQERFCGFLYAPHNFFTPPLCQRGELPYPALCPAGVDMGNDQLDGRGLRGG
jgi:hypothetical protein